jgi:hypothetical protein
MRIGKLELYQDAHGDHVDRTGRVIVFEKDHPVLERAQARQMLLQLGGWQRDTAVIQLGLGARYGEIAGLAPHDIDLSRGVVHIRYVPPPMATPCEPSRTTAVERSMCCLIVHPSPRSGAVSARWPSGRLFGVGRG